MRTNIAELTQSHKAIAAKKRARVAEVKEVLFDDEARHEFLTGFHKRKKAKADAAREKAKEREKEGRKEDRRERRKQLRERAIENAAEVERAYGAIISQLSLAYFRRSGNRGVLLEADNDDSDNEWDGIGGNDEQDEEYEGEQVVATVTVVEDFDPTTLTTGPRPTPQESSEHAKPSLAPVPTVQKKAPRSKPTKSKSKPKKIFYESKDERKREKDKQYTRKREKAALAGNKAIKKQKTRR
ncbi:hypothetical protein FA15DRAFT_707805 [Coprinopsis marcescibilis]|uniref:Nucleolar protein 12 n=1 Tax=Coprinopsis marcescibilis TaxID=230819 RepID=A0A5C3KKC3_COPMA|nr:hypothetical protein FA15DRAFT_707805 [Coprinopsis marcescibilis]